jgi:hypothetical protein
MMSKPSVAQLVTAIREHLSGVILPATSDPGHQKLVAMMDHLLQTIAVRAQHEIDWMVTHNRDVVALAEDIVSTASAPAAVIEALDRYREQCGPSLTASAVTANYGLAAEVLATILEATVSDTGEYGSAARGLLQRDVARGVQVVGEFELVPP